MVTQTANGFTLANELSTIEVRPDFGFNCVRWDLLVNGVMTPVLYRTPNFETNPVPTRNGHPILFPFPNRIRQGRFAFRGEEYQLPLTDSSGLHSIHGYTPRNAWRVIEICDTHITGEFQLSRDSPGAVWPADARIRLTYRLGSTTLKVEATIDAADQQPLPFGLGYHPYFTLGGDVADWILQCPVGCLWETEANIPTGRQLPIPPELDFSKPRAISSVNLDHPFGRLSGRRIATLEGNGRKLAIEADSSFRELLLFTPAHRQAIAIEPYTCTTDAANLDTIGIDSGWRILAGGESFSGTVEYTHSVL